MINKSSTIDATMLTRKFYCHKCGNILVNNSRKRIIKRGDPEYKGLSRVGRMRMIGDIEVTEYDFKCNNCDCIIAPDEQYIVEKIQKMLGKHILSEEELSQNRGRAYLSIERKKKITNIIVKAVFVIATVVFIYLSLKTGGFSFKLYF